MSRISYLASSCWLLCVLLSPLTQAQEHGHPPEDAELHDKFYESWLMPAEYQGSSRRTRSCCNKIDCYPAQVKRENGRWYVLQREHVQWIEIPEHIIEQNQPDPRESPDGRSHVCMQASPVDPYVFCFVHGSGT